jgi:DNA-binding NtrC family response regulator
MEIQENLKPKILSWFRRQLRNAGAWKGDTGLSAEKGVQAMTNKTILFVDDQPEICELAAALLGSYTVTTAFTFTRARNMLAASKFDLLVTDYHLLDGCGPDLRDVGLTTIVVTGDQAVLADDEVVGAAFAVVHKGRYFADELRTTVDRFFRELEGEEALADALLGLEVNSH